MAKKPINRLVSNGEVIAQVSEPNPNPETPTVSTTEPTETAEVEVDEDVEDGEEQELSRETLVDEHGNKLAVEIINVEAKLTKSRGRPEKGAPKDTSPAPTKTAQFERLEVKSAPGILPALHRQYKGNEAEVLEAINLLLSKKAKSVAAFQAFKIDDAIKAMVKSLTDAGVPLEIAQARADVAFEGLK